MTWFRNDRRVCENSHIRCVNEGNFYCIELTPVSLDDVGRWMCMAENGSGRNSCLCVLNVLVPKAYKAPEFVEHLRALLTEEGLVSLECKVIGVPTPLLRYGVSIREVIKWGKNSNNNNPFKVFIQKQFQELNYHLFKND